MYERKTQTQTQRERERESERKRENLSNFLCLKKKNSLTLDIRREAQRKILTNKYSSN
jgi:hypothetical protein